MNTCVIIKHKDPKLNYNVFQQPAFFMKNVFIQLSNVWIRVGKNVNQIGFIPKYYLDQLKSFSKKDFLSQKKKFYTFWLKLLSHHKLVTNSS
jgi:hypothetical protein